MVLSFCFGVFGFIVVFGFRGLLRDGEAAFPAGNGAFGKAHDAAQESVADPASGKDMGQVCEGTAQFLMSAAD